MQKVAFLVVCLACMGHGRRVHASSEQLQRRRLAQSKRASKANSPPSSHSSSSVYLSSLRPKQRDRANSTFNPLQAFRISVLAENLGAAWQTSGMGVRSPATGKFAFEGSRPVVLERRQRLSHSVALTNRPGRRFAKMRMSTDDETGSEEQSIASDIEDTDEGASSGESADSSGTHEESDVSESEEDGEEDEYDDMEEFEDIQGEYLEKADKVPPEDAVQLLQNDSTIHFIDMRTRKMHRTVRPVGSVSIPAGCRDSFGVLFWFNDSWPLEIHKRFGEDEKLLLICDVGIISAQGSSILQDLGHTSVRIVEDGFKGWSRADLPMEKGDPAGGNVSRIQLNVPEPGYDTDEDGFSNEWMKRWTDRIELAAQFTKTPEWVDRWISETGLNDFTDPSDDDEWPENCEIRPIRSVGGERPVWNYEDDDDDEEDDEYEDDEVPDLETLLLKFRESMKEEDEQKRIDDEETGANEEFELEREREDTRKLFADIGIDLDKKVEENPPMPGEDDYDDDTFLDVTGRKGDLTDEEFDFKGQFIEFGTDDDEPAPAPIFDRDIPPTPFEEQDVIGYDKELFEGMKKAIQEGPTEGYLDSDGNLKEIPRDSEFSSTESSPAPETSDSIEEMPQGQARPRSGRPPWLVDVSGHNFEELAVNGELSKLSVKELKSYLFERELALTGNKADLVRRISEGITSESVNSGQ